MAYETRPATREDLESFYATRRKRPLPTMTAWVGIVDGVIEAVGGINHHPEGFAEAFLDLTDKVRSDPELQMALFRTARHFLDRLPPERVILAMAEPGVANIDRWMAAMKFRPVEGREGLYQRWQG